MSARHTGSMDRPTMDYQSKRARKRCSSVADGSVHSYFMCKRTALIPRQPPEQMMSHTHRFCFTSKCSLSFFSLSLSFVCLQGVQCGNCPAVRLTEKFFCLESLGRLEQHSFLFSLLAFGLELGGPGPRLVACGAKEATLFHDRTNLAF